MTIDTPLLIRAAAAIDGAGTSCAPAAVLVEAGAVRAVGAPAAIGVPEGARVLECPGAVVTPGLVNAHAHLDLSAIGPRPYDGSFVDWIDMVRRGRPADDAGIADAVARGIARARAGGTAAIGDIAGVGSLVPGRVMGERGMVGVSFVEVFGIGDRETAGAHQVSALLAEPPDWPGVRFGLQPHAPYSCGAAVYRAAAQAEVPVATHLAETEAELEFLRSGGGPMAAMLASFGISGAVGAATSVADVAGLLAGPGPRLAVHLNRAAASDASALARAGVSVVFCPRASAYFGEALASHPAPGFAEAGVNVALGTDSVICHERDDRLSVLDEMRMLRAHGVPARLLLRMATIGGAVALGLEPAPFTLEPGPLAGLLALSVPAGLNGTADELLDAAIAEPDVTWIVEP